MKKFTIQIVLLLLVTGIAIYYFGPIGGSTKRDIPFLPSPTKTSNVVINDVTIKAEIADTDSKRSMGLSGREKLGENEGMLFIFAKSDKHAFWMKGLSFPLDFIWIKDNTIVDILEDIPAPKSGQVDTELSIYSAKVAIDKVLELNGGSVKKFNIKIGDTIKITNP